METAALFLGSGWREQWPEQPVGQRPFELMVDGLLIDLSTWAPGDANADRRSFADQWFNMLGLCNSAEIHFLELLSKAATGPKALRHLFSQLCIQLGRLMDRRGLQGHAVPWPA